MEDEVLESTGDLPPDGGRDTIAGTTRRMPPPLWRSAIPLALSIAGFILPSQATAQKVTIGGELRPRVEGQRLPAGEPETSPFTTLRTRINLDARLSPLFRTYIQVQDVRGWGGDLPGSFPNGGDGQLDLHQGYLEVGGWESDLVTLRAGRQEVGLGGERLVGAVNWAQQARSLDGVRARVRPGNGVIDLFGFRVDDRAASTAHDGALIGAYATIPAGRSRSTELYTIYDQTVAAGGTDQVTLGVRLSGTGRINYRAEGAYQLGTRGGRDVGAYLLGGRIGTRVADGSLGLTLWYDYLSGSDNPATGTVRVFDTILGTNHKYYGHADYFTNIPVHTAGRGLQDLAVKADLRVSGDVGFGLDLHSFHLARDAGLVSGRLGEEIDLTARWRMNRWVELSGGVSHLIGGEALRELGRLDGNSTTSYLMLSTRF